MDFKPIRAVWRGVQYDSQLESDWAATFTAWGMEFEYHPGRLFLSGGDIYEPDFHLNGDIIFECKGDHNDRIDKAWRASSELGLNVVIGRTGWLPAGTDVEVAGAVWEPEEWRVVNDGSELVFKKDCDGAASAVYAYARRLDGIRMFKAVGEDGIV